MKINTREICDSQPPYIIAELSANHNGSLIRAKESIEVAKRSGADAIKLQTYNADTMTVKSHRPEFQIQSGLWQGYSLYDLYKQAETPYSWHRELFDYANEIGITIFSTPFDETSVDLLEELGAPAYKIASFELTDIPLIKYVASTKKPLIISTGLSTEDEIEEAVTAARSHGGNDICLLHCISEYPANIERANLLQMSELKSRFGTNIGLSDHTTSNITSIVAVALGAQIIEKHFKIDSTVTGPDSDFSILPDQLAELCQDTKQAWNSLGKVGYERSEYEKKNLIFRRSLFFSASLPSGTVLNVQHIQRLRPAIGLKPKYLYEIIGRKLKMSVTPQTPVTWDLFE